MVSTDNANSIKGYTVELQIGPDEQALFIHSSLLSSNSEFFNAALKENWKEGNSRIIKMLEDDYDLVYTYVRWLYAGKIYTDVKDDDTEPDFINLAKLYTLGEKLLDNGFQDCVLNSIVSLSRKKHDPDDTRFFPGAMVIGIIYNGTSPSSPARKLLVHIYAAEAEPGWMSKWRVSKTPEEFKNDLITELLKNATACKERKTYASLKDGIPCEYHKHDKNKPCHSQEN